MATTAAPPVAAEAAAARVSSMGYADVYGAGDDTGPGSAVAGSLGYVAATEVGGPVAEGVTVAPAAGLAGLLDLGNQLLDSTAGLAFLLVGALLLLLWHDLAA